MISSKERLQWILQLVVRGYGMKEAAVLVDEAIAKKEEVEEAHS